MTEMFYQKWSTIVPIQQRRGRVTLVICIHLAYYQFVVMFKHIHIILLCQLVYDTQHVSIKRSRLMGHVI